MAITKQMWDDALAKLKAAQHPIIYTFIRADGFYPLELGSDEEAAANAECNPGTLRVENAITQRTVWQAQHSQ